MQVHPLLERLASASRVLARLLLPWENRTPIQLMFNLATAACLLDSVIQISRYTINRNSERKMQATNQGSIFCLARDTNVIPAARG